MENIILILASLLLGYMLSRFDVIPKEGSILLNKLVLYVSFPSLILLQVPKITISLELIIPAIVSWLVIILSAIAIWSKFLYSDNNIQILFFLND